MLSARELSAGTWGRVLTPGYTRHLMSWQPMWGATPKPVIMVILQGVSAFLEPGFVAHGIKKQTHPGEGTARWYSRKTCEMSNIITIYWLWCLPHNICGKYCGKVIKVNNTWPIFEILLCHQQTLALSCTSLRYASLPPDPFNHSIKTTTYIHYI